MVRASKTKIPVLDKLAVGFITVDTRSRIVGINKAAQDLADRRDGICIVAGKLSAQSSAESSKLHQLIEAASLASERKTKGGDNMRIRRASGQSSLIVSIVPLPVERRGPTVLVAVADPEQRPKLPREALQRLYGLTSAEAKLASHLVTGASLMSYLDKANIAHETARQHLKRIFAKTETHRQADLICALLVALGSIRIE